MAKLLPHDLRLRVVHATDGGLSCRQAAARYDIAPSAAIRWHEEWRRTGSCRLEPQGGDRWSHVTQAHTEPILAILEKDGDITLTELRARLAETGGTVSISALSRFFRRHGVSRKKNPATRGSRTARTSVPNGAHGSTARASSTPSG